MQVAQGLRKRDIAERLVRSERTVEHHASAVLAKLGLAYRDAALLWVKEEQAGKWVPVAQKMGARHRVAAAPPSLS